MSQSLLEDASTPTPTAAPKPAASPSRARAIAAWTVGLGLALGIGWWIGRSSPAELPMHPAASGDSAMPAPPLPASAEPGSLVPAPSEEARRAHEAAGALPTGAAAALDGLRRRLEATPGDLAARKELAVRLVEADRLVEAFEQAEEILKADAGDPDGLYVEGEVRLAMGQVPRAARLLDRVLTQHPDHLLALIARGKAAARSGDGNGATARWERALQIAGGRYAPVEALLAGARDGTGLGGSTGVAMSPPAGEEFELLAAHARPPGGGRPPVVSPPPGVVFRLRIALPAGGSVPTGGSLFVALRSGAGGPPVAVKRISSPSFPLDLTLEAGDSMTGQSLPPAGILTVRLDADGDASTQGPDDLSASVEATAGEWVAVRLPAPR